MQTPGFPHGDGDCAPPGCDVGKTLPIGAYLFNHSAANVSVDGQTFLQWYIDEYLFGPNGGANPNISGFFFDGNCQTLARTLTHFCTYVACVQPVPMQAVPTFVTVHTHNESLRCLLWASQTSSIPMARQRARAT